MFFPHSQANFAGKMMTNPGLWDFWEVSPSLENIWECVSLDGSSWLATIWCFSDLCNLSRRGKIHSRQSKYQELYALTVWTHAKTCVELGNPNVIPYMRLFALSLHVLELHVFILVANYSVTDHHCASISTRGHSPLVPWDVCNSPGHCRL